MQSNAIHIYIELILIPAKLLLLADAKLQLVLRSTLLTITMVDNLLNGIIGTVEVPIIAAKE